MTMGFDAVEPEQRALLKRAMDQAGIGMPQLWMKFFSLGGDAGEYEVDAYLNGSLSLPPLQRDILAHAANELIDDLPPRLRAPYSNEVHDRRNSSSSQNNPGADSGGHNDTGQGRSNAGSADE